jgi:hypothetical protein
MLRLEAFNPGHSSKINCFDIEEAERKVFLLLEILCGKLRLVMLV